MAVEGVVRPDGRFEVHPQFLLRWEASQDAYVLLYPEGIVKLNQTAGEILTRCTGKMPVRNIVAEIEQLYPDAEADIARSVSALLEAANAKGWIRPAA